MQKRMTITMDEATYERLVRVVGRRKISTFLEHLARPYLKICTQACGSTGFLSKIPLQRNAVIAQHGNRPPRVLASAVRQPIPASLRAKRGNPSPRPCERSAATHDSESEL
jgi:hypothetical protein